MDKEAQILKPELCKDEGSQTFMMGKLLHGLKTDETDATSLMLQAKQKLSQRQRFFFFNFWIYVLGFGFVLMLFLFKTHLDLNSYDF